MSGFYISNDDSGEAFVAAMKFIDSLSGAQFAKGLAATGIGVFALQTGSRLMLTDTNKVMNLFNQYASVPYVTENLRSLCSAGYSVVASCKGASQNLLKYTLVSALAIITVSGSVRILGNLARSLR